MLHPQGGAEEKRDSVCEVPGLELGTYQVRKRGYPPAT